MPTYEYACTKCGQHVEVFQRVSDDPLTTCGVCGGKLRKVFHPAGILFKGSGFYSTDSRATSSSGSEQGSKSGSSEGSSSEKSGDSKTSGDSGKSSGSGDTGSKGSGAGSDSSDTGKKEPKRSGAKEQSA